MSRFGYSPPLPGLSLGITVTPGSPDSDDFGLPALGARPLVPCLGTRRPRTWSPDQIHFKFFAKQPAHHERKRVYILAGFEAHASDCLSLLHFSRFSSMSSSAPESPSAQDPVGFRLGGSEKLRKPRWKLDELPDLTGKVVMITNPNNKVGRDTAKVLTLCPVPTAPLMTEPNRLSYTTERPFISLPLVSPRPSRRSQS